MELENECVNKYKLGYSSMDRNMKLSLVGCANIIQDMVTELFEHIKLDNVRLKKESNVVWVLVKLKIHFNKYPVWGEKVQATSFITNKSKVRIQDNIKIENGNGEILFIAKQESCPIDVDTRKIRKLETVKFPENLEIKKAVWEEKFERFNVDFQPNDIVGQREVYSNDTDYSNHTNNVSYVRFIVNMLNSEFLDNNIITDFEINYIHESKEGQILDIYRKDDENKIDFLIKYKENELVRARIKYIKKD